MTEPSDDPECCPIPDDTLTAEEVSLTKQLLAECQQLRETVEAQQELIDKQQQTITDQVSRINALEERVADLEADSEKTRDIARSASAKAEQVAADTDQQEDAEQLPQGVEPSSSPLDFFANCRQSKAKELFVEDSNRSNTYRAICVAKRWPEFAQRRTDGSGIFFTRDHLETALTAHLGESPHRQTIHRVWDQLQELGGDDVRVKRRQVSRSQEPKELLTMDMATAEGLLDSRYLGLDLLEATAGKTRTGGVTPVVTGVTG
ncbi:hypothetical protein ACFR9U_14625 [Halorientalis brevis]|uniref:Uncharacterized protein n=1 Tax=Halorientalis brevis TaxID=1126241 RepID=A0ABD6CFV2_9EURY|nr:hypothetical protein [Halorientalis brevis]